MFIPSKKKLPLNDCASCLHFKSSLYEAKLLGVIPRHFFLLFVNIRDSALYRVTAASDCCIYTFTKKRHTRRRMRAF